MKRNLFDIPSKIHEIFKNESCLYPDFVPEKLPHRDKEIDSLVYAFSPVVKGGKPINVSVIGPTGIGKTSVVKYVLNELEEHTDRAKLLYLNCFEYNTRHGILSAVTNLLGYVIPRRGMATDETYSLMLEALKKSDFTPIIVLDEVDQLLAREDSARVLYDLVRVFEHTNAHLGIVTISNNLEMGLKLDPRVKSSLTEQKMIFEPYSPIQLKDILRERVKLAFCSNSVEDDVVNVAAAKAAKIGGDCRIAIESLLYSGRLAERENAKKVTIDHLKKSFDALETNPAKKVLQYLNKYEKELVRIIAKADESISSGEIYKKFKAQTFYPITERRLRDFLTHLQTINVINAELFEGKGKTRLFSLKLSKDFVLKELKAE